MRFSRPITRPIASPIALAISGIIRGKNSFNPLTLSPTVMFDMSDMTTLYQDSFGTTPVTAAGQPVGLMLDKSQGLVLGPDVSPKTTTGWTLTNATLTYTDGVYRLTALTDGVEATAVFTLSNVIVNMGFKQQLNFAAKGRSGTSLLDEGYFIANDTFAGARGIFWKYNPTTTNFLKTPSSALVGRVGDKIHWNIRLGNGAGFAGNLAGDWIEFSFTGQNLPGNHASQPTAGKRPILQESGGLYSLKFDGVDDALVTTFPSSLGAGCTVCRSLPGTGASITTGVTIGTTFTDNVNAHALLIFTAEQWAALDAGQIAKLTTWLNGRAGL